LGTDYDHTVLLLVTLSIDSERKPRRKERKGKENEGGRERGAVPSNPEQWKMFANFAECAYMVNSEEECVNIYEVHVSTWFIVDAQE